MKTIVDKLNQENKFAKWFATPYLKPVEYRRTVDTIYKQNGAESFKISI